ncbi:MAG: hypothetical protein SGILL_006852 [Bacillariaceae sp.]
MLEKAKDDQLKNDKEVTDQLSQLAIRAEEAVEETLAAKLAAIKSGHKLKKIKARKAATDQEKQA